MGSSTLRHIVRSQQFEPEWLDQLFLRAQELKQLKLKGGQWSKTLQGKRMNAFFYQPSTRTYFSFLAAMQALGGQVIGTENAGIFSSAAKGESLADSIKVLGSYGDVIVLRYPEAGGAKQAAAVSSIPIINAGDGPGQHPTQALLDVFTIGEHHQDTRKLVVTLVGDLANGRTVHSLVYLLAKMGVAKFIFVAPKLVGMRPNILQHVHDHGIPFEETESLDAAIAQSDVIYMTRIQKEYFGDRIEDYERCRGRFVITPDVLAGAPSSAILMHPLPRVGEITPEVDADPRAIYFEQAANGLYVRAALLEWVLEVW